MLSPDICVAVSVFSVISWQYQDWFFYMVCSVEQCTAAIASGTQTNQAILSQSRRHAKTEGRRPVETYDELSGRQWLHLWVLG